MKLRIGNTRFDLTAGEGTLVRTMWRAGQAVWDQSRWGKTKYGSNSPGDVVLRYLSYKTSPGVSAIKSAISGKDFLGQPVTLGQIGLNVITPWNVNDVVEAWKTDGAGLGTLAGIGAFWGISAQSYDDRPPKGHGGGYRRY
jgi:hypothetical protein